MKKFYRTVDPLALARLIEESGVRFGTNKRSYIFTCPRCDKARKLVMFKDDGRFLCYVCAENSGFRGRPEFALTEILGMPLGEVQRHIYGDSSDQLPTDYLDIQLRDFYDDEDDVPEDAKELQKELFYPLDFYPLDHHFSTKGLQYLERRGVNLELARQYDLRYCPPSRRVIFPIKTGDKVLGWQARAIFDTDWVDEEGNSRSAPKILTTGKRENVLMFQDRLRGSDHVVICEGPVDAIKAHGCGGNVATMGKIVSHQQIELVRNAGVKKIYLALDPDAATETARLAQEFGDLELYRLLPPAGVKDLGDASVDAVVEQFRNAPRVQPGMLFLYLRGAH